MPPGLGLPLLGLPASSKVEALSARPLAMRPERPRPNDGRGRPSGLRLLLEAGDTDSEDENMEPEVGESSTSLMP